MEAYTIYLILALIAGFMSLVFPYVIKVWQDPEIKVDYSYLYATILSMVVSVIVLIPDGEFDLKIAVLLFGCVFGLNEGVKKANAIRIKSKNNK